MEKIFTPLNKEIDRREKQARRSKLLWKITMPKTMKKDRQKRSFWSKRRDSNPRSPVPEAIGSSLLTTFVYLMMLFGPKTMLSDALVRTVSTQSESVDGQRCGHRANFARLKARKLNRIYPVLSFIFVVSIAYFRKLVNIPFPKRKNWCAVDER